MSIPFLNNNNNNLFLLRHSFGHRNQLTAKTWEKAVQELGKVLKGQCHEDFAVLDQFWAKIITLRLYSLTKCFCRATTKISNEFYLRGLIIIKFLRIF